MKESLTLKQWWKANYSELYCSRRTQRWANQGRLQPAPIKEGREYLVHPDTVYVGKKCASIAGSLEQIFM